MKPIIGIVARSYKTNLGYDSYITYDKIRKSIILAGGIPINILPVDDYTYSLDNYLKNELTQDAKKDLEKVINLCDGIVLQGGSKWYLYDEYIASYVIKEDIPTLGICLGMQLLSFTDTNKKATLIESKINHGERNKKYVHNIKIIPNTPLSDISNKKIEKVNSIHRRSIKELNDFKVCAISPDGVIEGIYHPLKKYILGVQFHPEIMLVDDENEFASAIFKSFIDSCKK